jgi:hypothetical protein
MAQAHPHEDGENCQRGESGIGVVFYYIACHNSSKTLRGTPPVAKIKRRETIYRRECEVQCRNSRYSGQILITNHWQ